MLCASRNHDFDSFYSVLAGLRLRDRTAKRAGVVTRCFSQCLIFRCFWIKPKAQEKSERRKTIGLIFREASRTFDWASPARSGFTTFCHQKVAPKVSAGHLRRDRTEVLTERAQKTALFCTPAPGARTAVRSDSSSGAMRNLRCAARNDDYLLASVHGRPRPAGSHREKSG